jgi:serine/threonine-protein kinase
MDISATGTMVYASAFATSRLVWVLRNGVEQAVGDAPRVYSNPRIAPDGNRVVVQAGSLWILDLARATFTRVAPTADATTAFPMWTSDGQRIIARTAAGLTIYDADGSGRSQVIPGTADIDYPASMATDGDTLIMQRSTQETSFDILTLSLRNPSKVQPLVRTPAYEGGARISPDGKWLLYVSNESGQNEIYARPFPGSGRRWQVSTTGGTQATWNPNGRELFYRDGDKMMVVDVSAAHELTLSAPRMLFEQRYAYGAGITVSNYDLSRDGQRFLMVKDEPGAGRLSIVLNAFADLK